jgi:thiamine-phosphate pyrophosphorylase
MTSFLQENDVETMIPMLPRLYAIIDASAFSDTSALIAYARALAAGGAGLMQYRNKSGDARQILSQARELRRSLGREVRLIMNDRADFCLGANFDGVHVGQDDLSPAAARGIVGKRLWVGTSTHNPEQVQTADAAPVDYIAIGPVFATASKTNPDPVIGLQGVRAARSITRKPLVAIGGITRENALEVIKAGADSVAIISDLLGHPEAAAREFFRRLM